MMRRLLAVVIFLMVLPPLAFSQPGAAPVDREAEIHAAVAGFIAQRTANLGYEARIKRLSISGKAEVAGTKLDYEVVAPQQWEGWGSANLAVVVRQGERVVKNIPVRVEVEALADMVVTARQVDYGNVFSATDVAVRKQDISLANGRFLRKVEDVIGKKARVTLKANAPVRTEQLEKVPLIKPGQLVTIVAENERMRVTVTGKAKSAGAEGDTIIVQNLNSLKEIPARVVDANLVTVAF